MGSDNPICVEVDVMQIEFSEFSNKLRSGLLQSASDEERVRHVGDVLSAYLLRPDFGHDCMERVLLSMQNGRSHWRNPPIDSGLDEGFVTRMLFWPSQFRSDIHRHNLWTVTGVLYNNIEVVVYDESGNREISRHCGGVGAVGKVVPPCTHSAENNSDVPSVTLAVFCRRLKKDRSGPEVEWLTNTEEPKYTLGIYDRALRAFVFMINGSRCTRSLSLLDSIYDLAKPSLKLLATKAIAQIDAERAVRRLNDLEAYLSEPDLLSQVRKVRSNLEVALAL